METSTSRLSSSGSDEDEFFDANSSSSSEADAPANPTTTTTTTGVTRATGTPAAGQHEDRPSDTVFVVPKAPPRRNRRAHSIPTPAATPAANVSDGSSTTRSAASESGVREEPNWTAILSDDIASIQGDLSLNDAVLTGDKRSICVDDLSCGKSAIQESDAGRFRYDDCSAEVLQPQSSQPADAPQAPHNDEEDEESAAVTTLREVMIKNMDTGESLPLSQADDLVSKCINPLNLHLMKITNDYHSDAEDTDAGTSSIENIDIAGISLDQEQGSDSLKPGKQMKIKVSAGLRKFGRVGKNMIQGVKHNVEKHRLTGSRGTSSATDGTEQQLSQAESHQQFRLKVNRKGGADFDGLKVVQELSDCTGAIWCMKWSVDGQLLAVAGQDQLLRVYCSSKAWKYFTQLRNKKCGQQTSPCSTKDRSFSGSRSNSMSSCDNLSMDAAFSPNAVNSRLWSEDNTLSEEGPLLLFSAYRGHSADVLDISWSKNHFLLSSSMDKTVRLWHITRVECLCTLRHADFVTTISFHPKDDRYFLSGSLDGKLRLWNIPDKRVTLWNEVSAVSSQPRASKGRESGTQSHGLITASAFVQNGKFAVIGTYDGRVIFYSTDQLKYFTQLHVSAKGLVSSALSDPMSSKRGRKRRSNKVTGIESVDDNKILVTTNDSRLRLYDLRDLSLACKYKGCINISSQIRASVSHDNKYIVCGSENSSFYIWRMQENKAIGQRRDKNNMWESVRILPAEKAAAAAVAQAAPAAATAASSRTSPGIITAATFAPAPKYLDEEATYMLAVADFTGVIRLFSR